jgi:hypothetical protein
MAAGSGLGEADRLRRDRRERPRRGGRERDNGSPGRKHQLRHRLAPLINGAEDVWAGACRGLPGGQRPTLAPVTTITSKVTGKILDALATPLCASVAEKVDAVVAATIPRGAIQPMKPRSPAGRSVPAAQARDADVERGGQPSAGRAVQLDLAGQRRGQPGLRAVGRVPDG